MHTDLSAFRRQGHAIICKACEPANTKNGNSDLIVYNLGVDRRRGVSIIIRVPVSHFIQVLPSVGAIALLNKPVSPMATLTSSSRTLTRDEIKRRILVARAALALDTPRLSLEDHGNLNPLVAKIEKLGRHAARSTDPKLAERWVANALNILAGLS